jgi:hypothetical protein
VDIQANTTASSKITVVVIQMLRQLKELLLLQDARLPSQKF